MKGVWWAAVALVAVLPVVPARTASAAPRADRRLPSPGCDARYRFPDLASAPGAGAGYAAPKVSVSCAKGTLTVVSNGMIAYEFVAHTPNGLRAQSFTWKVPLNAISGGAAKSRNRGSRVNSRFTFAWAPSGTAAKAARAASGRR